MPAAGNEPGGFRPPLGLLRPLRLGWLKHRNMGIARIEPVSDSDIAAVTRKRKKRVALDPRSLS